VAYQANWTEIGLAGGVAARTFLADPDSPTRPGLLILSEIFGVNLAMQHECLLWAREGFLAAAPDYFCRQSPNEALPYTPEGRARGFELWDGLNEAQAIEDIAEAAEWLRAHPRCTGAVHALGFCLGGRLAVTAAKAADFQSIIAYYPVKLQEQRAALKALPCPAQVHLGADDGHVPPEVIAMIQEDVGGRPGGEVLVHEKAGHGFANSFRTEGYQAAATDAAFAAAKRFLRQ
jgi:carboxymethylenebutenolidase